MLNIGTVYCDWSSHEHVEVRTLQGACRFHAMFCQQGRNRRRPWAYHFEPVMMNLNTNQSGLTKCEKLSGVAQEVADRVSARAKRDAEQRYFAKRRYKLARKAITKEDRVIMKEKARFDKRMKEQEALLGDELPTVDEQGFADVAIKLGSGAVMAAMCVAAKNFTNIFDENGNVGKVANRVSEIFGTLQNAAKTLIGPLWRIPVILVLLWLAHRNLPSLIRDIIYTVVGTLIGFEMWRAIKHLFPSEGVEEQSGLESASTMLATMMTVMFLPKGGQKLVPEIMKRLSHLPRATDGMEIFFKNAVGVIEKIVNAILSLFSKTRVDFADHTSKTVKTWVNEAELIHIDILKTVHGSPDQAILVKAQEKIVDGYQLKSIVSDEKLKQIIQRAIDKLEITMRPYSGAVGAIKTFRQEPEFVLFLGGSKQGKTTLVTRVGVCALMLAGLVSAEEALHHLWQKGDTKYFESYFGQKCLVIDDCFQERAVPGMESNEFLQLIRMVGNWSCPLNMATLDMKGKFFFTSPLILGTTNAKSIGATNASQVINCTEAVVRRIHHPIEIHAHGDYMTEGGLDYDRFIRDIEHNTNALQDRVRAGEQITQEDVLDVVPWGAWTASRVDYNTGTPIGPFVDLKRFVVELAMQLKTKQERHAAATANINAFSTMLENAQPMDMQAFLAQPVAEEQAFWGRRARARRNEEELFRQMRADLARVRPEDQRRAILEQDENTLRAVFLQGTVWDTVALPAEWTDEEKEEWREERRRHHRDWQASIVAIGECRSVWAVIVDTARAWFSAFRKCLVAIAKKVGLTYGWFKDLPGGKKAIVFISVAAIGLWTGLLAKLLGFVTGIVSGVVRTILGFLGLGTDEQSNIKETFVKKGKQALSPTFAAQEEGGFQDEHCDEKHNLIYANSYKIFVTIDDKGEKSLVNLGQMQFVESSIAAMPSHFRSGMEARIAKGEMKLEDSVLLISCAKGNMNTTCSIKKFLSLKHHINAKSDLMFIDFSNVIVRAHRKINSQTLTTAQLNEAFVARPAVILDVAGGGVKTPMVRSRLMGIGVRPVSELMIGDKTRHNLIAHQCPTEVGMCGAPLVIGNPKHYGGRCLMGIHIAGTTRSFVREAYATPLTTEMIGAAVKYFSATKDGTEDDLVDKGINVKEISLEEQSGLVDAGLIGGSFQPLFRVEPEVRTAVRTKLKLSFIGESERFGPSGLAPAHLSATRIGGEIKYPMVEGLRNYQSPVLVRDDPTLPMIVDIATKPFRELSMLDSRAIFTFKQACEGVEGMKIRPINRSTSPGYPFVTKYKNGKKEIFGDAERFCYDSEACKELEKRVSHIIDRARDNERLAHICIDFLKDEMRPLAKVETATSRVIAATALDYLIAVRMYFGAYIASTFRHHTDSGMCPGINPYVDWWRLVQHLHHGENRKVFDGDFKRFDASEQPDIHWAILDHINAWYNDGPECMIIRKVLWLDLVHSRHLTGLGSRLDIVVQWNKSLPSGHPLTTVVNSLYSAITLVGCYVELTGDTRNVHENFRYATFGDDNLNSVSDDVAEVFNQVTVAECMQRKYGLTYTSGAKDGVLTPYKRIEECVFLKRGFYKDSTYAASGWAAPLDPSSYLYTSYVFKNNRMSNAELLEKLNDTLGEMSLHPPEVWESQHGMVFNAIHDLGSVPMYTTREGWRQDRLSKIDAWF